jgi:hypothetical protein
MRLKDGRQSGLTAEGVDRWTKKGHGPPTPHEHIREDDDLKVIDRFIWPLALVACAVGIVISGYVGF